MSGEEIAWLVHRNPFLPVDGFARCGLHLVRFMLRSIIFTWVLSWTKRDVCQPHDSTAHKWMMIFLCGLLLYEVADPNVMWLLSPFVFLVHSRFIFVFQFSQFPLLRSPKYASMRRTEMFFLRPELALKGSDVCLWKKLRLKIEYNLNCTTLQFHGND